MQQKLAIGGGLQISNVAVSPPVPKPNEGFTVTGSIKLAGQSFIGPLWVTGLVQSGSKVISKNSTLAAGGQFSISVAGIGGGSYTIVLKVYGGPTYEIGGRLPAPPLFPSFLMPSIPHATIPPIPALASYTAAFTVTTADFSDIQASFNGGGASNILKANGDTFSANISFKHTGPAIDIDVGIGLDYPPSPTFAAKTLSLGNDMNPTEHLAQVSGTFNTNLGNGRKVAALVFIQVKGGPRNIGGGGFLVATWYKLAFEVETAQFPDPLQAIYDGGGTLIPKVNGESFKATVKFQHVGAGGDFDVGVGLNYSPQNTWAYETITLPADVTQKQYSVGVSGIFQTDLGPNKRVAARAFIQTKDGPKVWDNAEFLKSVVTDSVYFVSAPQFQNLVPTYY